MGVPIPWTRAEPAGGGRELRVGYETDPCTKARRARVEAGDSSVKLTLGDPQRDPKKACIGVVERRCALVAIGKPLAGRKLVDGAPRPRPRSRALPIESFGPCLPVPTSG